MEWPSALSVLNDCIHISYEKLGNLMENTGLDSQKLPQIMSGFVEQCRNITVELTTVYLPTMINNMTESCKNSPFVWSTAVLLTIVIISGFTGLLRARRHAQAIKAEREKITIKDVLDMAKLACEPSDVEALIKLVKLTNFDINYRMPNSGLSLFLCACLSGQRKLINFLIKRGADLQQRTLDGDSALYLATFGILGQSRPDTGLLIDLMRAGCDVNEQNNKGYSPLHRAASRGHIQVIKCLLKHGADPYLITSTGIFPIDLATNAGHLEAAELLVIELDNPNTWSGVEPHTPMRVRLGLQSPERKHLVESVVKRSGFRPIIGDH